MRRIFAAFAVLALISCGVPDVVFVEQTSMSWGTIGLPTEWKVESKDASNITLVSLEEQLMKVTAKLVQKPQDMTGWAKGQAELTGRNFIGESEVEIDGITRKKFETEAFSGKIKIFEDLVIFDLDGQVLAVVAIRPKDSKIAYQATQIQESIKLKER